MVVVVPRFGSLPRPSKYLARLSKPSPSQPRHSALLRPTSPALHPSLLMGLRPCLPTQIPRVSCLSLPFLKLFPLPEECFIVPILLPD